MRFIVLVGSRCVGRHVAMAVDVAKDGHIGRQVFRHLVVQADRALAPVVAADGGDLLWHDDLDLSRGYKQQHDSPPSFLALSAATACWKIDRNRRESACRPLIGHPENHQAPARSTEELMVAAKEESIAAEQKTFSLATAPSVGLDVTGVKSPAALHGWLG
jgi:hypothetical protein